MPKFVVVLASLALACGLCQQAPGQVEPVETSTTFLYQGRLENGGSPVTGSVQMRFRLFNRLTEGSELWISNDRTVDVQDGLFTAELDFGVIVLSGGTKYLQIEVFDAGKYTALTPRQALRPAPVAIQAGAANVRLDGSVVLKSGDPDGRLSFVSNEALSIDDFREGNPFWQSFTAPYDADFARFTVIVKRASGSAPAPDWTLYEGEGVGGREIATSTSVWGVDLGAAIELVSPAPAFGPSLSLLAGQTYTIAYNGGDLVTFSETGTMDPFVGRSSTAPSIASVFYIETLNKGGPKTIVESTGALNIYSTSPGIVLDSKNRFSSTPIEFTFRNDTGGLLANWIQSVRPETFELQFSETSTNFGKPLLIVDAQQERLGLFDSSPLGTTHIQTADRSLPAAALSNDDVIIEDADAVLGIYSDDGGTFGSGITLGELAGGALVDKWSMMRRTSGFNVELQFAYGSNPAQSDNTINFALRPDGSAWLRGGLTQNSTASEKHDIETITGAIDTLLKLRGVSYKWNATDKADIGFIAEEMAHVIPDIVGFDPDGKPIGIDYGRVTALIVEATKDLHERMDKQAERLAELEKLVAEIAECRQ